MKYVLPVLILLLFLYAFLFKKVKLYDAFTEGAGGAIPLAVKLFPFLAAIFLLTELFEASGLSKAVSDLLSPVFGIFGIPKELTKLVLVKPFSGSGSLALVNEIFTEYGVDSYLARCACVIYGCRRNGLLHRRRLLCRHKFQASVKAHRHLPRRYVRLRRIRLFYLPRTVTAASAQKLRRRAFFFSESVAFLLKVCYNSYRHNILCLICKVTSISSEEQDENHQAGRKRRAICSPENQKRHRQSLCRRRFPCERSRIGRACGQRDLQTDRRGDRGRDRAGSRGKGHDGGGVFRGGQALYPLPRRAREKARGPQRTRGALSRSAARRALQGHAGGLSGRGIRFGKAAPQIPAPFSARQWTTPHATGRSCALPSS